MTIESVSSIACTPVHRLIKDACARDDERKKVTPVSQEKQTSLAAYPMNLQYETSFCNTIVPLPSTFFRIQLSPGI